MPGFFMIVSFRVSMDLLRFIKLLLAAIRPGLLQNPLAQPLTSPPGQAAPKPESRHNGMLRLPALSPFSRLELIGQGELPVFSEIKDHSDPGS